MSNLKPSLFVKDITNDRILLKSNSDQLRPVASITKLVTAMVALDDHPNLDEKLLLVPKEKRAVYDGEFSRAEYQLLKAEYTRKELLTAMMVTSDNNASETLAVNYSKGYNQFIIDMNAKVRSLGGTNFEFKEPHGSFDHNKATVEDISKITIGANRYEFIKSASILKETTVSNIFMENINKYILTYFGDIISLSKTGLTCTSGYCATLLVEKNDKLYTVTILGTNTYQERFDVAKKLLTSVIR